MITELNSDIMKQMGFGKEIDRKSRGACPFCGEKINPNEFKDELSKREFKISGLCQKCQDKTFGSEELDEYAIKSKKILKEEIDEYKTLILTTPDTFYSTMIKGYAKQFGFVRDDQFTFTKKVLAKDAKNELKKINISLSKAFKNSVKPNWEIIVENLYKKQLSRYSDVNNNGINLNLMRQIGIGSKDITYVDQMASEIRKKVGDSGTCVLGDGLIARVKIGPRKFKDFEIIINYSQGNLGPEGIYEKVLNYLEPKYPNIKFLIEWGFTD